MVKIALGVVLSIALVYGSLTLADNLDLFQTDAMYDQLSACNEANRLIPEPQKVRCYHVFGEQRQAADTKEMMVGVLIGLILAGLGWLIAWSRYNKRRRQPAEALDQGV